MNSNVEACIMCGKLAVDPYRTYCGCTYCRGCIVAYSIDRDKYCRGEKNNCKYQFLEMERNVSRIPTLEGSIQCPSFNIFEGNEGYPSCVIGCDNNSLNVEKREDISLVKEEFRMNCQQMESLKVSILGQRREITAQTDQLISENNASLRDQMEERSRVITATLSGQMEERSRVITATLSDQMKKQMRKLVEQSEVQISAQTEQLISGISASLKDGMEGQLQEIFTELDHLRSTSNKHEKESNEKQMVIEDLKKKLTTLNVGTNTKVAVGLLSLTVDSFSKKMMVDGSILSPYFYSHTNGYKLQLQVYPGGYSGGRGTHLSVYIHTYQGEYDDVLPWPCRHTFTLSITNQYDGVAYASETFNFENTESHLSNQIKGENYGLEGPKFVSHEYLKSVDGLIVKDNVIVRCVVNGPL